jgi:hypothetical protein
VPSWGPAGAEPGIGSAEGRTGWPGRDAGYLYNSYNVAIVPVSKTYARGGTSHPPI